MARILVRPEGLRMLSSHLQQAAQDLAGLSSRLSNAWSGLDWAARQKAGLEARVNDVRSRAGTLATQAENLGRYLASKAQAFEEADRAGESGVRQAVVSFNDWWQSTGYASALWNFPGQTVRGIWSLGGIVFPQTGCDPTYLPAAGGASLLGLAPLTHLSGTLGKWAECLWNWLHGYGWQTNAQLVSPLPEETAAEQPKVRFGDLLRRPPAPQLGESRPATGSGTTAETAPLPETATQPSGSWWWEVPAYSQHGLKLPGGASSAYGCVPTATSMILDYWHAQNPANKTMSAQDLLTANVGQGKFHAGMSPSAIQDELEGLGYVVIPHVNAQPDALKEAVARGPVIAVVKLGMQTSGVNHAVVVTGISSDKVRINDPWDGRAHTYTWDEFSRSWGADFGPGAPKNSFVEIHPS